jgi:mannose-1-phosphate guanylyltransferase/mannose-6-phosphate isomerase
LRGLDPIRAPIVVASDEHRFLVAEQLREINVDPLALFLEPVGRNTAPALAIAALRIVQDDPDGVLLALPADHHIPLPEPFRQSILDAVSTAQAGFLVTFGVAPRWPETGYGYIEKGELIGNTGSCHHVSRFLEKPNEETAARFISDGNHYWNSGMFLFSAKRYLSELQRLRPAVTTACETAFQKAQHDLDFIRLEKSAMTACPSISVDYAVLEHTDSAAVLPVQYEWSDLGSWKALWEADTKDEAQNVVRGDVVLDGVRDTYVHAENRLVAAIGVDNLVIVETADVVLVSHKDDVQKVRLMVDELGSRKRSEATTHKQVYRPWGSFEGVDHGERFQVKRITVNPGCKLSMQMHHHRAEHWVVVSGTAKITRDDDTMLLTENQSTYIPVGVNHRLENPGKIPLRLIEIQSGPYLGEDDIVRFEDMYNRV